MRLGVQAQQALDLLELEEGPARVPAGPFARVLAAAVGFELRLMGVVGDDVEVEDGLRGSGKVVAVRAGELPVHGERGQVGQRGRGRSGGEVGGRGRGEEVMDAVLLEDEVAEGLSRGRWYGHRLEENGWNDWVRKGAFIRSGDSRMQKKRVAICSSFLLTKSELFQGLVVIEYLRAYREAIGGCDQTISMQNSSVLKMAMMTLTCLCKNGKGEASIKWTYRLAAPPGLIYALFALAKHKSSFFSSTSSRYSAIFLT